MSSAQIQMNDPKQLRLSENGEITWQKDPTNPLPGEKIASLVTGQSVIAPLAVIDENEVTASEDKKSLTDMVQGWLDAHIKEGLEPLFRLQQDDLEHAPAKNIAQKLFDALGIIPREDLQADIDQMDEAMRQTLRPKKIRFGPLLVYLPELKKPAAVRMQALLLSLWSDKALPAEVPADGIVSFSTAGKDIDADYYRAIGYPVYGPRVMRVDMLDRVVCAVYDNAKDGKFQAQHQMAEWLGSNIEDLYLILEAMGHKKISEPTPKEEAPKEEVSEAVDVKAEGEEPKAEVKPEAKTETKTEPQEKPELATFALKRGKASGQSGSQGNDKRGDKPAFKKKYFAKKDNKKSFKGNKGGAKEPRERVYKAEAKSNPEDSPFAILGQLKVSGKDD